MDSQEKNESKARGGIARAAALSPERRREIAQRAASKRWASAERVAPKPPRNTLKIASTRNLVITVYAPSERSRPAAISISENGQLVRTFSGELKSSGECVQSYLDALRDMGVTLTVSPASVQAQAHPTIAGKIIRTTFLDFDSRPEPKTDRWCAKCQRDIKSGRPARVVRVLDAQVLHPDDAMGAGDEFLVGLDCAEKIGMEWSRPEEGQ